jgi:hypothetical protein
MRSLLLPTSLVALAALAATTHCQGRLAHLFGGYAYNATLDCLEASGAVDVIAGADPGLCPMLRCWAAPDGTIYVTDEACDAPPDYVDHTQDGFPPCVKALALYDKLGHELCPMPDAGTGGFDVGGP